MNRSDSLLDVTTDVREDVNLGVLQSRVFIFSIHMADFFKVSRDVDQTQTMSRLSTSSQTRSAALQAHYAWMCVWLISEG